MVDDVEDGDTTHESVRRSGRRSAKCTTIEHRYISTTRLIFCTYSEYKFMPVSIQNVCLLLALKVNLFLLLWIKEIATFNSFSSVGMIP